MLHVVHSNRMEHLADRLADLLGKPATGDPFEPEHVVVQSPGMGRWLSLRLADRLGVTANVAFRAPQQFLYEVAYRAVLGTNDVPAESWFRRDVLVWSLLRLFPEVVDETGFEPLARYLAATGPRERHQLATRIADAFDRLTVWRPDWIASWERDETVLENDAHERWQSGLWGRLRAAAPDPARLDHRAAVQARFRDALARDPEAAARALPSRVAIVGGASIPREALLDFMLLSKAVDVHVLFPNPCSEEWTSIRDRARIAREAMVADADPDDLHLYDGHPLLASWGRQGQAFLAGLLDAEDALGDDVDAVEEFVDPVEEARGGGREPSLLEVVQSDILRLEPTAIAELPREPPSPRARTESDRAPRSIQVHACHSPMREIEVLHDRLLELFEHHSDLDASDVVVLAPDIDAYAPYVDAVFGAAVGRRRIRYGIADRAATAARPLVEAVLTLLDLPSGRLEVGPLLDLLDVAAIRGRFGIEEDDLPRIRAWAAETGIRWGVDAAWRVERGAPAFEGFGWRDGLDRLIAAYAIGDVEGRGPASLEGEDARVAGRLHAYATELFEAADRLSRPVSASAWAVAVRDALTRFLSDDVAEDALERLAVDSAVASIARDAGAAGFDTAIDPVVFRAELAARLATGGAGRFLAGGVTFCRTTPLRAVPFPVVALVGMHADAFPRPDRTPDFDLLERGRRPGDPSRREDDRYLFLEALLSARRHLIVTYVGRGVRDHCEVPPAIPVDELLDCVNGPRRAGDDPVLATTVHPLQPFSGRYRAPEGDGRAVDLFTYRPAPLPVGDGADRPLVVDPLRFAEPLPDEVDLDDLLAFVMHPSRWFVQRRLGMILAEDDPTPEPREPFAIEGLDAYLVGGALADALLAGEGDDAARSAAEGTGRVPPSTPGRVMLDADLDAARAFVDRVREIGGAAEPATVAVDVRLPAARVVGAISVYPVGCVVARPAKLKGKDRLQAWVRHVALAARPEADGAVSTWCVGNDAVASFPPLARADAARCLADLVDLYRDAHQVPARLFPEASWVFVRAEDPSSGSKKSPGEAAFESLDSERGGEAHDAHVATLFPGGVEVDDTFRETARRVFGAVLEGGRGGDR